MTLRLPSSDSYANILDISWTASQFADSRQNQKNISSADSSSLRLTTAPALTAFLKTIYNKVARQLLSPFIIAQAQTAIQVLRRTTPASIYITPQKQKSPDEKSGHICICSISRINKFNFMP